MGGGKRYRGGRSLSSQRQRRKDALENLYLEMEVYEMKRYSPSSRKDRKFLENRAIAIDTGPEIY